MALLLLVLFIIAYCLLLCGGLQVRIVVNLFHTVVELEKNL